jgi:hypothetical protein
MHEDDRDHQVDDEAMGRTGEHEARTAQAPVVRLLANPRRIRRA